MPLRPLFLRAFTKECRPHKNSVGPESVSHKPSKHELLNEREGHAASRWVISSVPVLWRGDPRSRVKRKANIEVLTIESRRGDHPLRTDGATIPIELAGGLPTSGGTVGRL